MARPSFLSDEHIPKAVAVGLRARGIDAATATEAGQLGVPDAALMAFAQAQGRVLITADPDHLRLHAAGVRHAGLLFVPPDAGIALLIGGAMLIAEVLTAEEMASHVEFYKRHALGRRRPPSLSCQSPWASALPLAPTVQLD